MVLVVISDFANVCITTDKAETHIYILYLAFDIFNKS